MDAVPYHQKIAAEALGTCLLVACVVGSGIMAQQLSGGNDGVALLGNTAATSALLYVLIIMFGQTSGAHFNPAVSLVMMMRRALPPGLGIFYILAQIAGGGAGTLLAHAMFDMPVVQLGIKMRTGTAQHLSEAIATAGLVLTILLVQRADASRVPVAVASYITAGYWFTASTCFANPAVTLARALTDSFAGIRPIDVPGFIGAQLAGALVGLAIATFFARSKIP